MCWSKLHKEMHNCNKCSRYPTRQLDTPFYGFGYLCSDIMFVAEGPGYQTRQKNGMVLCGNRSGDHFLHMMSINGFHFGNSYLTNVVKCQKMNNEKPSGAEIDKCSHFLETEIKYVDPLVIVAVGSVAIKYFFPSAYGVSKYIGNAKLREGRAITGVYHPAYILRKGGKHPSSKLYQEYNTSFKKLQDLLKKMKRQQPHKKSKVDNWM